MAELDKVYLPSERVISRKIVDEFILVPIRQNVADTESLYTLNDVGARIYELIDGQRSAREIAAVIVDEFAVSPEQAETDVLEFLDQLLTIGSIDERREPE
jgi:hypothetical protein